MQLKPLDEWMKLALSCAKGAGELSIRRLKHPLNIKFKTSTADLVTAIDVEVEKWVIERIRERYPEHGILSEEGTHTGNDEYAETVWVIDPIDGTTNLVHQQQNYVVSIAVYHRGEGVIGVVYDPSRDELFYAQKGNGAYLNGHKLSLPETMSLEESLICTSVFWNRYASDIGLDRAIQELAPKCRGLRLFGCAAMELAYVAAARLDAYFSLSLNPWDFGAGRILVEEAGGKLTSLTGEEPSFHKKSSIFAATPGLYDELADFVRKRIRI